MNGGLRLGRLKGIEVVADASAAVLALLFGTAVFVDLISNELASSNERALVLAVVAGVLVVVSILLHEAAHAVVGTIKGQKVLGIRLFMFGGYSVIEGKPSPLTEFQVALAGPAASIILGLGFWVVSLVVPSDDMAAAAMALSFANVAIGIFNLFPGFPLDGGRVLRGLIAARGGDPITATHVVALVGRYTGWIVMFIGAALILRTEPAGLFWLLAGWFLSATALQTGRREELAQTFAGQTASTVMRPVEQAVPGTMAVDRVRSLWALGPDLRSQPVEVDGKVVGVLGQAELDSVAPSRWGTLSAARLMTKIGPADVVEADEPLENLLVRPAGTAGRVIVVDAGTVVGIIEPQDLS